MKIFFLLIAHIGFSLLVRAQVDLSLGKFDLDKFTNQIQNTVSDEEKIKICDNAIGLFPPNSHHPYITTVLKYKSLYLMKLRRYKEQNYVEERILAIEEYTLNIFQKDPTLHKYIENQKNVVFKAKSKFANSLFDIDKKDKAKQLSAELLSQIRTLKEPYEESMIIAINTTYSLLSRFYQDKSQFDSAQVISKQAIQFLKQAKLLSNSSSSLQVINSSIKHELHNFLTYQAQKEHKSNTFNALVYDSLLVQMEEICLETKDIERFILFSWHVLDEFSMQNDFYKVEKLMEKVLDYSLKTGNNELIGMSYYYQSATNAVLSQSVNYDPEKLKKALYFLEKTESDEIDTQKYTIWLYIYTFLAADALNKKEITACQNYIAKGTHLREKMFKYWSITGSTIPIIDNFPAQISSLLYKTNKDKNIAINYLKEDIERMEKYPANEENLLFAYECMISLLSKETNKKELLKIYEDKYLSLPYKTEEGGDILLKNGEVEKAVSYYLQELFNEVVGMNLVSNGITEEDFLEPIFNYRKMISRITHKLSKFPPNNFLPLDSHFLNGSITFWRLRSIKSYFSKANNQGTQNIYQDFINTNTRYILALESGDGDSSKRLYSQMQQAKKEISRLAPKEQKIFTISSEIEVSIPQRSALLSIFEGDSCKVFTLLQGEKKSISFDVARKDPIQLILSQILQIPREFVIYIIPDGIYNTINIGAIMQPNGRLLMEDYDIRIVTSARELIEKKEKKNYDNTAVLVGNPAFNLAIPKQTALAANYTRSYTETPLFAWPTLTRGSIAPLPNTKAEVENIGKILQAKGFKTQTLLGEQALEEAVKSVKSPRILHIATHGFFEADVTKKDSLQADDFMGIQRAKAAENPLLRSGLLFAGAENYLKTKKLSKDYQNGILTAYEAMNLDLENTELVVLSACETGLGDIKNGEGVYGLQRALRIAGAQSVLMSLAKVPDAPTKILMEAFYDNWLTKGMNKHEALKQAQLSVRKIPQYAAPSNWASFVLVE